MAKLTGFNKVAAIVQNGYTYYYALYDDGYKYAPGDKVLVSGRGRDQIWTILGIYNTNDVNCNDITSEIICPVDTSAFDMRVQQRRKAMDIQKKMDKIIKNMDISNKYEMYAQQNPELNELLKEYKEIVR